ncbi:MAG: hypothetical protein Q9225_005131 [Loekoesia sp. 1 TL-2023]
MSKFNVVLRDGLAENNDDIYAASTKISPSNKEIFPDPGTRCYKGWLGIKDMLLNRPYWRRTWIYQEATVSPASTRFYCGNSYFNMILVSASVFMANHFTEFAHVDFHFQDIARCPAFAISSFRTDGKIRYGDSLLDLIDFLRSTETSEPRDKVYALLGTASDLRPSSIEPEYLKSLEDVYTDVARFSLSQPNHGLQVLGHVMHFPFGSGRKRCSTYVGTGFPTWVPDFRLDFGVAFFCTNLANFEWPYSACGPNKTHNARIEGRRLILEGIGIDQISSLSETWEDNRFSTAEVRAWAPKDPGAFYFHTGQTLDEAFRATVLADMNVLTKARGLIADWDLIDARNDTLTADQHRHKNMMNVALGCASGVRRLCWTKAGRMGLAPDAARVDDLLYVLCGGQTIYVLRPTCEGVFEFVGASYIHGIMDGELFESNQCDTVHKETVVLE